MNKRTKTLLLLWQTANMTVIALVASAVTLMATGFGELGVDLALSWLLLALVAMFAFRYAFYRSLEREIETVEKPE